MQVSFGPYYTFFMIYMEQLGWSSTLSGALISLGVVAEIILFLFSGQLLKRYAIKSLLIFAMLLTVLRWSLLAWLAESLPVLLFIQVLHAASFALAHAASMAYLNQQVQLSFKGRAQALYASLGFGLGGAIGAFFAGIFWQEGQGATLTLMLSAGFALIGAAVLLRLSVKDSAYR